MDNEGEREKEFFFLVSTQNDKLINYPEGKSIARPFFSFFPFFLHFFFFKFTPKQESFNYIKLVTLHIMSLLLLLLLRVNLKFF